ncbi:MAG: nucleotidyltransferase family protein [Anaerolineae bacterium]|nr:nucleotidyltransferase family protein [Anaerolineae bacterium]
MHLSRSDQKLLLVCTRQQFTDSHRQTVYAIGTQASVNWDAIYETATIHGVASLVYTNLQQCPDLTIPAEIETQFRQAEFRNILQKERNFQNLSKALAFFAEKSLDVMVIKGGALDILVYDQPYYTTLLDVDLVIKVHRRDVSDAEYQQFRHVFHRTGLEFDYFEHHDILMNGTLPVDFEQIWRDATPIDWRGHTLYSMAPEDMLIASCINSCRKRYFRLKALCDIAEIINKHPDLDWTTFIRKVKQYDCCAIVFTALRVTQMTVECTLPDHVLRNLGVDPIRSALIQFLCRHTTFDAFLSLHTGKQVMNRKLDPSLILSYVTLELYQVWRRLKFIMLYEQGEQPRTLQLPFKLPRKAIAPK